MGRWTFAISVLAGANAALSTGCGGDGPAEAAPGPAACAAYAFSAPGGVRVFAVQPKTAPEYLATYASFRDQLVGLVEADVAPCLAEDHPNVIVFPEDVGLPAAFIGTRAAGAREQATTEAAFLRLASAYGPVTAHYRTIWPDLGLGEGALLGMTDTLWRAFFETMQDIARSTGAWVIASTNVSGAVERSTDPDELAAIRDPDLPDATYVYVARERAVYNTAFAVSPAGEIVGAARKPYLVELEETSLQMTYGALRDARPLELGDLRLAILTSKDAWMPDVTLRQVALGANVLVQPEAFSGWTISETADPDEWLPDVFRHSAWSAVQRHGGLRYGVVPHLTGNLVTQVFDGQSAVLADAHPGERRSAYVGQEDQGGFLSLAPWAEPDPGAADPSLSLEERRSRLRAAGEAREPGGARANEYVETVVAADIDPTAPFAAEPPGPAGTLGASRELEAAHAGAQTNPAAAGDGAGAIWVAWQGDADGAPRIFIARSTDGGESFDPAARISTDSSEQRMPAVIATATSVYVAWQEEGVGGRAIRVARSGDGGRTFAAPATPEPEAEADQWMPSLATDGEHIYLAYVRSAGDEERVRLAQAQDGTGAWSVTSADGAPPAYSAPNRRNNQWAPAVAAKSGEVMVAWLDFRNSNWDVFAASSSDGGLSFAPAARIDDGTDRYERLHDDTALVYAADGPAVSAWTDRRFRMTPARPRVLRAQAAAVDPSGGPAGADGWRPRLCRAGDAIAVVWQDFRAQGNDIYLALSSDGGRTFGAEQRIDDGGDGPSYQLAPVIADAGGGRVFVAWEDTRSGASRLRGAAGTPQ